MYSVQPIANGNECGVEQSEAIAVRIRQSHGEAVFLRIFGLASCPLWPIANSISGHLFEAFIGGWNGTKASASLSLSRSFFLYLQMRAYQVLDDLYAFARAYGV